MGDLNFLIGNEDFALAAALAFTLEFFESEKPPLNVSLEKKPTHYFENSTIDEMDDDYVPQYDKMKSRRRTTELDDFDPVIVYDHLNDQDIEVIEQSETVSTSSLEHRRPRKPVILERDSAPPVKIRKVTTPVKIRKVAPPTKSSKKPPAKSSRWENRPEPTRGSSRLLILQLAREEAAKKKASEKEKAVPKKRGRPRKVVEPVKDRKKREKEERAREETIRKQRKAIRDATKSVVRTFGVVASAKSKTGKLHLNSWIKWVQLSTRYLHELATKPKSFHDSAEFHVFLVNSITVMQHTLISYRPRPEETHELMLRFIGDFTKIWNLASRLGANNMMGDVGRLLEYVLGHFIAHPERMQPTNLPWIQTKVILDKILSIITRVDVIYDTMILLNKMMANYLGKWARRNQEGLEFKSYALSTFHSFFTILNGRLSQVSLQQIYHF